LLTLLDRKLQLMRLVIIGFDLASINPKVKADGGPLVVDPSGVQGETDIDKNDRQSIALEQTVRLEHAANRVAEFENSLMGAIQRLQTENNLGVHAESSQNSSA
jgi:hypothetical protein